MLIQNLIKPISRCILNSGITQPNSILRTIAIQSSLILRPIATPLCLQSYRSKSSLVNKDLIQTTCLDPEDSKKMAADVFKEVNKQISNNEQGRLFAIVFISGKQVRITENDLIIVDNNSFAPRNGDKIKFEKILLVGGSDFSLIGRPMLTQGQVEIIGTIIEKDLSHTRTNFRLIPRKRHRRFRFFRTQLTMIRINKIEIKNNIGQRSDVEGIDRIIY